MTTNLNTIKEMTNLTGNEQDDFITGWMEYAKLTLYEMGVSQTFIDSASADYCIAKIVTDLVEDSELSKTTEMLINSLRTNHPHSEDEENV